MAFWTGILEIGRRAGLIEQLSAGMRPVLHFLFPRIPAGHPALSSMAANMIANMLGLGWAATPAGLTAMKELEELEEERRAAGDPAAVTQGTASDEMCTFLVVNISSLQLIPINMIAYRSQYGSVHPLAVAGPAFLATCVSTLAGVAVCRVMCRRKQYKSIKRMAGNRNAIWRHVGEKFHTKNKFIPYNALVKIRGLWKQIRYHRTRIQTIHIKQV